MKTIYQHLVCSLQQRLAATGIPQDKAISASVSAVGEAMAAFGGREVYLPKRNPWRDRDSAIRREFNGRNLVDICGRFDVSRATVYRVTKK